MLMREEKLSLGFSSLGLTPFLGSFVVFAKDFGVHVGTLDQWKRQARTETGDQSGVTTSEPDELKALRKRNRLLEQENEVLRRAAAYLSQANLPPKGSTRS